MTKEAVGHAAVVHATYAAQRTAPLKSYVSTDRPEVETPLVARFGDYLELVGYRAPSPAMLARLRSLRVRRFVLDYYFHVLKPARASSCATSLRGPGQVELAEHVRSRACCR